MGFANPKGRNWTSVVNWDGLGKFYASIILIWTTFLVAGVAWLILHRNLYFLRIRNVPIAVASTLTLQLYLIKIFLAYTTNDHFPCGLEYWVMAIYLPFGIAFFQLNIAQIHSVSSEQSKLMSGWTSTNSSNFSSRLNSMTFASHPCVRPLEIRPKESGLRRIKTKWNRMASVQRTELVIGVGMVVQVIVSLAVYLGSRKFHPAWGSFGDTHKSSPARCRRGAEWIPTAIWQLVFSWGYGPYILYKIRHIKDVHYWRMQIILCVVSGLPGTPMWLASLYGHKTFKDVNSFWVPPMWLAPGIMVMQFCTIFFPIYEAYTAQGRLRDSLHAIKASKHKWSSGGLSTASIFNRGSTATTTTSNRDSMVSTCLAGDEKDSLSTFREPANSTASTTRNRKREIYSMAALEKALAINPTPLLQFATRKDFTGENIIFLIWVRQWRAWWDQAGRDEHGFVSHQAKRQLFRSAVEIYLTSVNMRTSVFPINIPGRVRLQMENLFRGAVWTLDHTGNTAYEADMFSNHTSSSEKPNDALPFPTKHLGDIGQSPSFTDSSKTLVKDAIPEALPQDGPSIETSLEMYPGDPESAIPIPAGFNAQIFDAAEREVKYMVVTNTWRRFVDSVKLHEDMKMGAQTV